jgi:hypothetical protein
MSSDMAGHHATYEGKRAQRAVTAPAVRARQCLLCQSPAGEPCQPKPEGDHLARYLDARTAGQLTREYMNAVLAELVVIDVCVVITIPAQPSGAACQYCGREGQRLGPCCHRDDHRHQMACADVAGCRDYLLGQLKGDER